ncbi:MAG: hypothetical protein ACFFD4_09600 [Candidatus Odinarchaeota archaeon]
MAYLNYFSNDTSYFFYGLKNALLISWLYQELINSNKMEKSQHPVFFGITSMVNPALILKMTVLLLEDENEALYYQQRAALRNVLRMTGIQGAFLLKEILDKKIIDTYFLSTVFYEVYEDDTSIAGIFLTLDEMFNMAPEFVKQYFQKKIDTELLVTLVEEHHAEITDHGLRNIFFLLEPLITAEQTEKLHPLLISLILTGTDELLKGTIKRILNKQSSARLSTV